MCLYRYTLSQFKKSYENHTLYDVGGFSQTSMGWGIVEFIWDNWDTKTGFGVDWWHIYRTGDGFDEAAL